ncbi:hypothetical protein LINGRAHAP2_LOCUS27027, partial [Linum grandiflorum]
YCSRYGKKLDFDSSFQRTFRHMEQYEPIVRRMIDEHDGQKIRSLKLDVIPTNDVDNQVMVANWINKSAQKGVEELELNFGRCLNPFRSNVLLLDKLMSNFLRIEVLTTTNILEEDNGETIDQMTQSSSIMQSVELNSVDIAELSLTLT